MAWGVALLATAMLAGCGGVAKNPRPPPSPGRAASATASAAASAPTVILCPIDLAGTGTASPGPLPATLPASLPLELLPHGDAVYAVAFPEAWGRSPLYTVGPLAGQCWVTEGAAGFSLYLVDAVADRVLYYEEGGGVNPIECRGSRYLAAARATCERVIGQRLPPSETVPAPGELVTPIATGVPGWDLALVVRDRSTATATASLYSFRTGAHGDDSWLASCSLARWAATCYPALAFIANGSSATTAAIGAALGRAE